MVSSSGSPLAKDLVRLSCAGRRHRIRAAGNNRAVIAAPHAPQSGRVDPAGRGFSVPRCAATKSGSVSVSPYKLTYPDAFGQWFFQVFARINRLDRGDLRPGGSAAMIHPQRASRSGVAICRGAALVWAALLSGGGNLLHRPAANLPSPRPWQICDSAGRRVAVAAGAGLDGDEIWSGRQDSNLRPTVPKTVALPGCATPRAPVLAGSAARGKSPAPPGGGIHDAAQGQRATS